jgi:N utilization substance protein B
VERNLLRLGAYEIYFSKSVPPKVAISEAVRLARKFASSESANFINAILDALYKKKPEVVE